MKTVKLIRDGGSRFAILSMFALFAVTGCSAHPSATNTSGNLPSTVTDSVMRKAIGDSIYSIIIGAKKIKAEAIKLANDTISNVGEINVNSKNFSLIRFIVSEPKNYISNTIVYGKFRPCFTLTFTKKKECCILNFDFGLRKWNVCDSKGRVIKTYDLSSGDMLRLADSFFHGNRFFESLINFEQK